MNRNLTLLFAFFLSLTSFSQTIFDYNRDVRNANLFAKMQEYEEALNKYEQALTYDFDINVGILNYNAACMASMAGFDSLGFVYLNQSIIDGFILYDHFQKDSDLNFLRKQTNNWENSMELLEKEVELFNKKTKMLVRFCDKRPLELSQLVPYKGINGKWGYMIKKSKKKIVDPIFDLADFFGESASIVFYKTNEYKFDKNGLRLLDERDVEPKEAAPSNGIVVSDASSDRTYKEQDDPRYIKFVRQNQMRDSLNYILGPYDEFVMLEEQFGVPISAVKYDTLDNRYILINHKGEIIHKFSEKYKKIERAQSSIYPLQGRMEDGKWQLIDSLGVGVPHMVFDSTEIVPRTQAVAHNIDGSVWKNQSFSFSQYAILYRHNDIIIYNRFDNSFDPIIGQYKTVFTVNSPYKRNYRYLREKYADVYFLVEDCNGDIYFIDKEGNQYK